MTPQQAISPRVSTSAIKLLRSSFRVVWAAVVFLAVCLMWLVLLLLFLPFLLLAEILRLIKRDRRTLEPRDKGRNRAVAPASHAVQLIFDRRNDVSKLYGCNTRNVRYRWSLFKSRLDLLEREFELPTALDFGAGSLRDSYELALRGFKVISFDLNENVLNLYFESYDWSKTRSTPLLTTGSLSDLTKQHAPNSVQLVTAFDVIEHLQDPASYIQALSRILCARGFLFVIVPNRRSLFERYFKRSLARQRKRGFIWQPGVPHLQFRSPDEWDHFFEANGFHIVDHDMTIGPFVNDWWNGLLSIPLRRFVYPVVDVIAYHCKFNHNISRIEGLLCPPWLMERVNVFDQALKKWIGCCFGWNLIVAQKLETVELRTNLGRSN